MNQNLLTQFGNNPFERVEKALNALCSGQGILVTDDERRENEGDMFFAADSLTIEQMASIRQGDGGNVLIKNSQGGMIWKRWYNGEVCTGKKRKWYISYNDKRNK